MPSTSVFDKAILKKTIIKFNLLDIDTIEVTPQRKDYMRYNGSNLEEEYFNGGKSLVFSVPEAMFDNDCTNIDITVHAYKEISKYFEMDTFCDIGTVTINIDLLFNGIINELKDRKDMVGFYTYYNEREPISR